MADNQAGNLERIRRFRLIDDDFMNVCFTDLSCVELVLQIILSKPDLTVKSSQVQKLLKGLERSIGLDIFATDSEDRDYDIELQRDSRGADPKRARFHSSLLDAWGLKRRQGFAKLRETWVIFITETDVLKQGLPLYTIDRHINETGNFFGDGSHIVYVNGAARNAKTPLGQLMHDFFCANPDEMYYPLLANRTRYFKEDKKGIRTMSYIMDEIRREGRAEGRREGRREGIIEGEIKGRAKMLFELVRKGLLSVADASASAQMSEDEFLSRMQTL